MASWRRIGAALIVIALSSALVLAQQDSTQVYQDVKLLRTIGKLQLTPEQMAGLLAGLEDVQPQRVTLAELRATVWEDHRGDIEAVNEAWLRGRPALSVNKRAADRAIGQVLEAERKLAESESGVAEALRKQLTEEQQRLVETPRQAQQRRQRQERLEGAATVGEYVAAQVEQMRDLMADEYRLLRSTEAQRMAARIVGREARELERVSVALLAIMDQVMSWSPQQFGEQRESLPAQISASLGIREQQPSAQTVRYEELLGLVRSERAAALLAESLRAREEGWEGEPVQAGAQRDGDELAAAMHRADCLNFLNSRQVDTSQLQRMVSPLGRIQQYLNQRDSDWKSKLTRLSARYGQARQLLVGGQELPEDLREELTGAEEAAAAADLAMTQSIHGQMEALAKVFYPIQNEQLDWTPPADIRPPETTEQRAARYREVIGLINDAGRMLERVRYLPPHDYVTRRVGLVGDYLARYLNPTTPQFEQAHAMVLQYTGEIRMVDEAAWSQQAPLLAERLVRMLGLMPAEVEPAPKGVSWQQLYDLFTNPATVKIVQEMIEART